MLAGFLALVAMNVVKGPDWLLNSSPYVAKASIADTRIVLSNGLVACEWTRSTGIARISLKREDANFEYLRATSPEARLTIGNRQVAVGGLEGQRDRNYLDAAWLPELRPSAGAMHLVRVAEGPAVGAVSQDERPAWAARYGAPRGVWPPRGRQLRLTFIDLPTGLETDVVYELYDGLPVLAKWLELRNPGSKPLDIEGMRTDEIAINRAQAPGLLYMESEYAFNHMAAVRWRDDPAYGTQPGNSLREPVSGESLRFASNALLDNLWAHPDAGEMGETGEGRLLLTSQYPQGPDVRLEPGSTFRSFRTFLLLHDTEERERQSLSRRRMYRALAPWTQENPMFMHLRSSDSESIRRAVDQCAATGFEMVILTFWSGFDMNNEDPAYIARMKADFDYAHSKGIKIGGYVLFSSTASYSKESDAVQDVYPPSLCLGSEYSDRYFKRLLSFIDATGMDIIETDGPYHGYPCASTEHKYHKGLDDSVRVNWERQRLFFHECRKRGLFINAPDWYFFSGSNKTGMGYREENWSLPRDLQIVIGRQNVYDGTWAKLASMGWMMLPLVEYHGGGAAATLEPLDEHRPEYEAHLAQNFGTGVMACYRGPRLYDTEATRAIVAKWAGFYKQHREVLAGDVIHVRRPDGRDVDCMMLVNPRGREKALAVVYNPLDKEVVRDLPIPLYYAGLTKSTTIRGENGRNERATVGDDGTVLVRVKVPARGRVWLVFSP